MMQRRRLNASRNIGFSAIELGARVEGRRHLLQVFFQKNGTRPQRIGTRSRRPSRSRRTTSTFVVGAML